MLWRGSLGALVVCGLLGACTRTDGAGETGGASGTTGGAGGSTAGSGSTTGGAGGSGTMSGGTAGTAGSGGKAGSSGGGTAGAAASGGSGTASGSSGAGGFGAPGGAGGSGGDPAGTAGGAGGAPTTSRCDDPTLVWRSANKTNYTSYPDPGSDECIKYNGCLWAGQFAACNEQKPEAWVAAHDIVAAFPDFDTLELHDLCLRKGAKVIVVTVLDTCGDSDCGGCCTENQGSAEQLIDVESYTNTRWGVADGAIEWADLGPTAGSGCD